MFVLNEPNGNVFSKPRNVLKLCHGTTEQDRNLCTKSVYSGSVELYLLTVITLRSLRNDVKYAFKWLAFFVSYHDRHKYSFCTLTAQ